MSTSPHVDVPVFAGQGTFAIFSPQTRRQALRDAASPSGAFLLSAFHQSFCTEMAALHSAGESVDIDVGDFATPLSLLNTPFDRHLNNAVLSGTTLFIIQSLRYLAYIEDAVVGSNTGTPSPLFTDALKENIECGVGVLGFSSGILPACVVAASPSRLTFVVNAVESFRLAFWIGVRCMQHRVSALNMNGGPGKECSQPWSLVVFGLSRKAVEEAVERFLGLVSNVLFFLKRISSFSFRFRTQLCHFYM
jgi:hypothetical protein